jgi:hypothetical protein
MKHFVKTFFRTYGADVHEHGEGLKVDLPDDLHERFEQASLNLVFDAKDVDETSELVTHGGYVLSVIHSYLQDKGLKLASRLPDRHTLNKNSAADLVRIENGTIHELRIKKERTADLIFHFKITFLSDEKSETLYAIGIDRHGSIFDANTYYSPDVMEKDTIPLAQKGDVDLSRKDVEKLFRECLKAASERAREEAVALQKEVLKRLHRNVVRIKGYYTAQVQELHRNQPSYEEKRLAIEREQQHKLQEEINNHRIRIVIKLLNFHLVERGESLITLRLKPDRNHTESSMVVQFDHYSGTVDYGECPLCGTTMDKIVLTADGQIGCPQCVVTCTGCGKIFADVHRESRCAVCEKPTCTDCLLECRSCRRKTCADHAFACSVGNEMTCTDCLSRCDVCGTELCSDHVFVCAATRSPVCFEHRVICKQCRRVYSSRYVQKLKKNERKCSGCGHELTV